MFADKGFFSIRFEFTLLICRRQYDTIITGHSVFAFLRSMQTILLTAANPKWNSLFSPISVSVPSRSGKIPSLRFLAEFLPEFYLKYQLSHFGGDFFGAISGKKKCSRDGKEDPRRKIDHSILHSNLKNSVENFCTNMKNTAVDFSSVGAKIFRFLEVISEFFGTQILRFKRYK